VWTIDYNPRVLRRLTAAALLVLVQIGAIAAPMSHVHLDVDETAHHHGQSQHAHLSGHSAVLPPAPGPVVDHQDESGRVVTAQVFVAAASDPFSLPVVVPPAFVLLLPPAQPHGRTPHVAHAHDPPPLAVGPPRAPPASLS
jgi:hypothetical protein